MTRPAPLLVLLGLALVQPARGDEPAKPATVKLATFNIHHAEGADGVLDLGRVAGVVRGADVIAFQEVDVKFDARSKFEDQAARLGTLLEANVVFGGNLARGDGRYGVAIVSKYPIRASKNHPLPRAVGREAAEPRGLLEATVDVRGRPLRVFATHFAHDSAEDRRLQVEAVRKVVLAGEGPAVLMGDLNMRPTDPAFARLTAPPEGSTHPLLVDAWPADQAGGATIGLGGPRAGRIDYVLGTPDIAPGFRDGRVDTRTKASDHQPLFMTLQFPGTP